MKKIPALVLASMLVLTGCVQTGEPRFEPDYAEAARINTRLGMDYLAQGRVELAQFKFEKALEQDDSLARTHLGMALVHEHFEEYKQARRYFEDALNKAPRDSEIQTRYARFLCRHDGLDAARPLFDKATGSTRNPKPEFSFTELGGCLQRHGELAQAEAALRKALELKPRHAPALLEMARLSHERGDFLRARAFLQRYESVASASVDSLLLALRVEYQLGDEKAAQGYARRLKQMAPGIENRVDLTSGRRW